MGLFNKVFKKRKVYISYDDKDLNIAQKASHVLEDNGCSCWFKDRDAGINVVEDVVNAIRDSNLFILIFSKNSADSKFVTSEVDYAFTHDIPLLVFRVDNTDLDGGLEYYLDNKAWMDAFSTQKDKWDELTDVCLRILDGRKVTLNYSPLNDSQAKDDDGAKIFISYSSMDSDIALKTCEFLEEHGMKCWMAPRDIEVGSDYNKSIMDGLHNAKVVVLICSDNSYSSKFVVNEIKSAFESNKYIIPLNVDDSMPSGDMGFYLNNHKHIYLNPLNPDFTDLKNEAADFLGIEAIESNPDEKKSQKDDKISFQDFEDDDNYIFISYKHLDKETIYPIIKRFNDAGFKVWYDDGLKYGEDYDDLIDYKIDNCTLFLIFITERVIKGAYDPKEYMKKELDVAIETDTKILPVFLDDVKLKGKYRMQLRGLHSIFRHEYGDEDEFIAKCIDVFTNHFHIEPELKVPPKSAKPSDILGISYIPRDPNCDIYKLGEIIFYKLGYKDEKHFSELSDEDHFKWEANAIRALCVAKASGWNYPEDLKFHDTEVTTLDKGQSLYRTVMESIGWTSGKYDYDKKTIDLSSLYHYPEEQALLRIIDCVKDSKFEFK